MAREEAVKTKNIFVKQVEESKFQLKRIRDYFFQVHGQLFVSLLPFVDFVVYFGSDRPIYVERIYFKTLLWQKDILPKLEYFYKRALEILTEKVKRKKTIYIQGGWVFL